MIDQAARRVRQAGRVLLALVALFGLLMMPLQPASMASDAHARHAGHGSLCHDATMLVPDQGDEGAHGASHSRPATAPATHHGPSGGQSVLASHCTACCLPLSAGVLALPVRAAVAAFEWPHDISLMGRELEPAAPPPRRVS